MAARSWAGSALTAAGVAAGAGAAQLGVGYGLGIVAWQPATAGDADGRVPWLATLAWVVWLAASSTVLGAVTAHWLAGRGVAEAMEGFLLGAWRATLVLSAAIGALVTVPLVAVPARIAETPENFAPEWTAAGYVVVGVIVGVVVAVAALTARAIAANVVASVAYLWVLAIAAVVDSLRQGDEPVLAQLAIWEFNGGPQVRGYYVPGVMMMLAAAAIIGFLAAWRAGRRGDSRVGVAMSGATGPLLVAAAYLLAAPQFAGEDNVDISQWSAAMFAPYAVLAGLAGSVLVAAIGPPLTPEEKAEKQARAAERRAAREAEREARQQARQEAEREAERQAAERRAAEEAREASEAREIADARAAGDSGAARAVGSRPVSGTARPVPVSADRSDDDLVDWPSTLEDRSTRRISTAKGTTAARDPDDDVAAGGAADLADDAYAPARAYATDMIETEETPSGSSGPTGSSDERPAPKAPLWPGPPATSPDDADPPPPPPRGRPRRR